MKNVLLYLLFMALTAYIMVMYEAPYFYGILWAEGLMLLLCFCISLYLRHSIHIEVSLKKTIIAHGDPVGIMLRIKNTGFLPVNHLRISMLYHNEFSDEVSRRLIYAYARERSQDEVTIYVESSYCGRLQFYVKHCRVSDYLNLFSFSKKVKQEAVACMLVTGFPVQLNLSSRIRRFSGDGDNYSKVESGDDPSEVFELRGFRQGDRMQRIHWKMTARSEDFVVKEFSKPLGYPIVLFIEFAKISGPKASLKEMNHIICLLFSISRALIEEQCPHYVAWMDDDQGLMRFGMDKSEDLYGLQIKLLDIRVQECREDAKSLYSRLYGSLSFCAFVTLRSDLKIIEDEEELLTVSDDQFLESAAPLYLSL